MHKTDAANNVANEFSDGTPPLTPGTSLGAKWHNTIQRELVKVVEDAGLVLDDGDDTQVRQALDLLYGQLGAANTWTALQSLQAGAAVTQSAANTAGVVTTGAGTGAGIAGTGGATGAGGSFTGGVSGAAGVVAAGTINNPGVTATGNGTGAGVVATGGALGNGVTAAAGATSGYGVQATGSGAFAGVNATGGATGPGIVASGGATSGDGIQATGTGTTNSGGVFTGASSGIGAQMVPGTAATATTPRIAMRAKDGYLEFDAVNPNSDVGFTDTLTPMNTAKAWAKITTTGGGSTVATINAGFNVASASVSTTTLTLNIANDLTAAGIAIVTAESQAIIPQAVCQTADVLITAWDIAGAASYNFQTAAAKTIYVLVFGAQ